MRDSNVCVSGYRRDRGLCGNLEPVGVLCIQLIFCSGLFFDKGLKGGVHMGQKSEEYTIEWRKEQIKNMVDGMNANCGTINMIYGFVRKCFELSSEKVQKNL